MPSKMTITEALAEIRTIGKRLSKKRQAVQKYVVRPALMRDPHEKDGGSTEWVAKERQAVADLEVRLIQIRCEIQRANLEGLLTIGRFTQTIAWWLAWRREVAADSQGFLNQLAKMIDYGRQKAQQEGGRLTSTNDSGDSQKDVVVELDEAKLLEQIEEAETVLGELDGKLTLFNSRTEIEVE